MLITAQCRSSLAVRVGEIREVVAAFCRNSAFCGVDLNPDNESLTIAQYMQKVHEFVVNRE